MKKYSWALIAISLSAAIACNNAETTDSTKVAEENNEQKMNSLDSAGNVGANRTDTADKVDDDQKFMVEAASGGMMEVELGSYAAQNAVSAKVKQFGSRMVKDHTKANEELKALASQKNISIPATPGNDHMDHINDMKAKKGADFDKAYMSMMVDDHNEDVDHFQDEAENGKDAAIKAFAMKTLPVLKMHLQMAKSIHDGLK